MTACRWQTERTKWSTIWLKRNLRTETPPTLYKQLSQRSWKIRRSVACPVFRMISGWPAGTTRNCTLQWKIEDNWMHWWSFNFENFEFCKHWKTWWRGIALRIFHYILYWFKNFSKNFSIFNIFQSDMCIFIQLSIVLNQKSGDLWYYFVQLVGNDNL